MSSVEGVVEGKGRRQVVGCPGVGNPATIHRLLVDLGYKDGW